MDRPKCNYLTSTDRLEDELRGVLVAMRWKHLTNRTKAKVLLNIQKDFG
ncbi:hypothetical protein SynRS9907_00823 [Synechococcus sp. RS9907]|nr:hypothetical protein SynRS9907_00823 [Synechococcus sp. RS9907]